MSIPDHVLLKHVPLSNLPLELIESLNQTYFLHLLVTEPQKVIPPGKSFLSMMTHANFKVSDSTPKPDKRAQITNRVKEVAHKAFWNEALEHLSSPLPSVQIPRLRQLYPDLHESLGPLFPPNHRILVSLSSPLPPTSSPLLSTVNFLVEILTALRQRCAPIRDQAIDDLLSALSHPPQPMNSSYGTTDLAASPSTILAEFVIEKLKATLDLAENMKTDLNTFVLGSMTEAQLQGVLLNDVKVRERELVLNIWGGKDVVRAKWRTWISEVPTEPSDGSGEKRWVKRLFRALGSDQPIHCMLPSTTPLPSTNDTEPQPKMHDQPVEQKNNELPPQLFFSTPSFLYIQNCLQAIIISAALRSLTLLSASTPSRNTQSPGSSNQVPRSADHDFMTRIWTLLKAEIDDDAGFRNGGNEADNDSAGHTKIINLADEVIRSRQLCLLGSSSSPAPSAAEEKRLRDAVERTLRSTDPVFQLLKKRLVNALEKRIILLSSSDASTTPQLMQTIPTKMQTGKNLIEERAGKRPRLKMPESVLPSNQTSSLGKEAGLSMGATIPGFEDRLLQQAIVEALQKIVGCIGWVEGVWGDLV